MWSVDDTLVEVDVVVLLNEHSVCRRECCTSISANLTSLLLGMRALCLSGPIQGNRSEPWCYCCRRLRRVGVGSTVGSIMASDL